MSQWIKMRMDLATCPKVVRIMSATGADKFRTIGGLHAVWSVYDQHSLDGMLVGYTADVMDAVIGWPGFANAMIAVEWLHQTPQGLMMPRFEEHNGTSAKRRADDTRLKRVRRLSAKCPQNVRSDTGQNADQIRLERDKDKKDNTYTEPTDPQPKQQATEDSLTAHQLVLNNFNAIAPIKAPKMTAWSTISGATMPLPIVAATFGSKI